MATTAARKIIHLDMDCFFAAVEMRDNPSLRYIPLAIGGNRQERGVISTCNYPARAFGIRSAMPTHEALKRCPHLTLLRGNMEKYRAVSQQIQRIFRRYTELVEPLSLDEAYLDVSDCPLFAGSATRIASDIRRVVLEETGLTVSAGVAPNKFLAKIASDENKPDGLFVIPPNNVAEFVRNLPLHRIPGVGQKTAEKLNKLGFTRCHDLILPGHEPTTQLLGLLVKHFGSFADTLIKRSQGIDDRAVQHSQERKSIGVEQTLPQDLAQLALAQQELQKLLPTLAQRLSQSGKAGLLQKIGVKLKFSDFRQTTVETQSNLLDWAKFEQLLSLAWQRRQDKAVRLIGVQVGFKSQCEEQLTLPF